MTVYKLVRLGLSLLVFLPVLLLWLSAVPCKGQYELLSQDDQLAQFAEVVSYAVFLLRGLMELVQVLLLQLVQLRWMCLSSLAA